MKVLRKYIKLKYVAQEKRERKKLMGTVSSVRIAGGGGVGEVEEGMGV